MHQSQHFEPYRRLNRANGAIPRSADATGTSKRALREVDAA
jgi:hypothetical protein